MKTKRSKKTSKMNFGIIAAGEGSRLVNEGVEKSKPLLNICGEPMIGRLIRIYERAGAKNICVVINSFMPDVKEYLESLKKDLSVPLILKVQTTPSSMHTFYELSQILPDRSRFIATTVDTIFKEEAFQKYVDAFRESGKDIDGMMAVTDFIEDEKPLYVEVDGKDDITGFLDVGNDGLKYVSGGIYGLGDKAIDVLEKAIGDNVSRMRNYQRLLIKSGLHLKAFPMGKIVDVDHVSDIARAEDFLEEKEQ